MLKTNVNITILGEYWREKVFSVFGSAHLKSHFWAPEYGHFWQFRSKVPKNGSLSTRIKNVEHFFTPTTPQNGTFVLCVYHFWESIKLNLKKCKRSVLKTLNQGGRGWLAFVESSTKARWLSLQALRKQDVFR